MRLIWMVMKLPINPRYKPPKTGSRELRTYVTFYGTQDNGPEPSQTSGAKLFECTAEVYKPSMKDLEVMKANGTEKGLTIKIRDPLEDYVPTNKHKVTVHDRHFKDDEWEITDIRPDPQHNKFIVILLGATS